jgi:hypothetical protein
LSEIAALLHVRDACFYSLQQGPAAREARDYPVLYPLSDYTSEIVAAAAAMTKLDLIITVDGMTAHLAGALGRSVWVLLKHDADWRWMEHRSDSPWYPSMRLFRQDRGGGWHSVINTVVEALKPALRNR